MKKKISLDDDACRFAGGHYVEQSMPGANPKRDKMVSDAIAKLKQGQSAANVRQ